MIAPMSRYLFCMVLLLGHLASASNSAAPTGDLWQGFMNPPPEARPRVWWHWMNGNVTREGITADLQWMARVGIGGMQIFDASLATPRLVEPPMIYGSKEWREAMQLSFRLANELGMEAGVAGSPGWSETGGPWVTPEQAMKKLVWSETPVHGGRRFLGTLKRPADVGSIFQNSTNLFSDEMTVLEWPKARYYADAAVIAFRVPTAESDLQRPIMVDACDGPIEEEALSDGDLQTSVKLRMTDDAGSCWVRFEFAREQTIRSLTLAQSFPASPLQDQAGIELQTSDDGIHYVKAVDVPGDGFRVHQTIAFDPVRSKYFRVVWSYAAAQTVSSESLSFYRQLGVNVQAPAREICVTELVLHAGARVHRAEEKAGFVPAAGLDELVTPAVPASFAIDTDAVVDLSASMSKDGRLDWLAPRGDWIVLRLGYSPTGLVNSPASAEATGLEVDKLNAAHVREYLGRYLALMSSDAPSSVAARGPASLLLDSWEVGAQNWTEDLIAQFERHRGYDPRPWLPALTGRIVRSADDTEKFLWDFRRTLAELVSENHYDVIAAELQKRGMKSYAESHEGGRAFIADGMTVKRSVTTPMSALWAEAAQGGGGEAADSADIRESVSVANLYGKRLVAAEALTAGAGGWFGSGAYAWSPEMLKPTVDKALALGVNQLMLHTSAHQPFIDKKPGFGLGPFGQWFTRNETWAEAPARAWLQYMSRSSFLLQQGRLVSEIGCLYGEESNVTALTSNGCGVPGGYRFDYVNPDALQQVLKVCDHDWCSAGGARYRILVLDPSTQKMTLTLLLRLRALVEAGGTLVGKRPAGSPSLADETREFQSVADELWNDGEAVRSVGNGHVIARGDLATILRELKLAPDFEFATADPESEVLSIHRHLDDAEIYFVNHRSTHSAIVAGSFRVTGMAPELWHADTGRAEPAAFRVEGGRTIVTLPLDPWDAIFVVFREPTALTSRAVKARGQTRLLRVAGTWNVRFQPDRGEPLDLRLSALKSWSDHPQASIRYYSGSAVYTHTIEIPRHIIGNGRRLWLDFGGVGDVLELRVNGRDLGVLWKAPFRADVTEALRAGENLIEATVTNLWANRMIGDRQAGQASPYTFSVPAFYSADAPLRPAGLLGPVQMFAEE